MSCLLRFSVVAEVLKTLTAISTSSQRESLLAWSLQKGLSKTISSKFTYTPEAAHVIGMWKRKWELAGVLLLGGCQSICL